MKFINLLVAFVMQVAGGKNQCLGAEETENGKSDYLCLNSSGHEVGAGSGVCKTKT